MRVVAFDTETFYIKPTVKDAGYSVGSLGNWRYAHDPRFDCYLLSVYDGEESWVGHPKDFNWESLTRAQLVSHNASFDSAIYARMVELGQALKIDYADWACSANLTSFLCNRRSLAQSAEHLLGVNVEKGMRDFMNGKTWADAVAAGKDKELIEYARGDVVHCWNLWDKFSPQWTPLERGLSNLTIKQCARGVAIDVVKLQRYRACLGLVLFNIEKSLPWVADGAKVTSPKAIAEECRKHGIPCPPVKSHEGGEEAFIEWEETYGPKFAWVSNVGQWRSINKVQTTLDTINERLRPDNTIDFSLLYFGAHCVTGATEVLTRDGWVPIEQWRGGEIAQWKAEGSIEFLPASANAFKCSEELVGLDAPYAKGEFTKGHTIPLFESNGKGAFAPGKAGEVSRRCESALPIAGHFIGGGSITSAQMRVLVAVQADGHWTKDGILQFCLRKRRKICRIGELLGAVGIPFSVREFPSTPGQVRVSVARRDCPSWLCQDRKYFGPWLLDSTPDAREAFCDELGNWDGHRAPFQVSYYSSILKNMEWASTILHLSGRAMKVRPKDDAYHGAIRETSRTRTYRKHWRRMPAANRTVYCPTTQTGFWLYRHRGVIAITGNTGRWSGGGSGLNMQNPRKDPIYIRDDYSVAPDFEENLREVIDVRSLFIPRPGHKFVISDLSQIEPRVLNWLCGNFDLLDRLKGGMSIYEAHARDTMGWTGGDLKKENPALYKTAKARVLGLGYGCGKVKFKVVAKTLADLDVTELECEKTVTEFRESNPKIVKLWNRLDNQFKNSTGKTFELELPSGRTMRYERVLSECKPHKDEKGKWQSKYVTTADIGGRRVPAYGGKLTENLVQATARDVFGEHLLALDRAGVNTVFHVHDEIVAEMPLDANPREVEQIMSQTPEWLAGCPIGAEAVEAAYYKK